MFRYIDGPRATRLGGFLEIAFNLVDRQPLGAALLPERKRLAVPAMPRWAATLVRLVRTGGIVLRNARGVSAVLRLLTGIPRARVAARIEG